MTHRQHCFVVAALVALAWPAAAQQLGRAQPPVAGQAAVLFREGLMLERAEGKLEEAIFRYERVVAEFPRDNVAPQALYRLALAYDQLKDSRATMLLNRLVAEYPNASPYAADARANLAVRQGAAAGPFKAIAVDPTAEAGSPDGRLVAYHKDQDIQRLYVRDIATGAERVLLNGDGSVSNLAWSPDSRRLAFNFSRQTGTPTVSEIRIVNVSTGDVSPTGVRGYPMAWTTSDEIFFYRPNYAANTVEWSVVKPGGGEPALVLAAPNTDGGFGLMSADGKWAMRYRDGKIVLRGRADGAERLLMSGSGREARPVFSPDGRVVAWASNQEGTWAVYAAPIDRLPAQAPVKIATVDPAIEAPGTNLARPWWTAGGMLTIPVRRADRHIYKIAMDATGRATNGPERLTQDLPENFGPVVSPDGARIAYSFRQPNTGGIAVMNADGTSERPLVELKGTLPIFWRNAEEILFYDFAASVGQKPAITSLNVNTGVRQPVAKLDGLYWYYVPGRNQIVHTHPGGGGARPAVPVKVHTLADGTDRLIATIDYLTPALAVSPDGRRFAYSVSRPQDNANNPSVQCEVAIMSVDGVREKVVVPMQQPCAMPSSWSPDGRLLLLDTVAQGPRVVNVDTGASWSLADATATREWGQAAWSPDGSFVVLSRSTMRIERLAWEGVTYDAVVKLMNARK